MAAGKGKISSLLEGLPHPAFLVRDGDRIEAMNSRAITLTANYRSPASENAAGSGKVKFFGDIFPHLKEAFQSFIQNARFHERMECAFNGGKEVFQVEFCSLLNDEGVSTGTVITLTDISRQKETEKALKKTEWRYHLLANNVVDVIWTLDRNLAYTYVSPSVKRLSGFTPEERMKQSLDQVLCPDSHRVVMEAFEKEMLWEKIRRGKPAETLTFELEHRRKDGSTFWAEVIFRLIRDHEQNLTGIVGITRDITSRRRMESDLKAREQNYRLLVEFGMDIIYQTDWRGRFTYVNPAAERLIGYQKDELIGRHYLDIVRPDYRDAVKTPLEQQFRERSYNTYSEFPAIKADGREIWIAQNVQLVTEGDRVTGFQAVARDITKRIEAEKKLQKAHEELEKRVEKRTAELARANEELSKENEARRESEKSLELLSIAVEQSREGLVVCDTEGIIIFINKAFAEMHGYSKEEATGRRLSIFHTKKQLRAVNDILREIIEKGYCIREVDHKHRDGREFPTSMHVTLLKNESGKPFATVSSIIDITEAKLIQEKEQRYIAELEFLSRSAADFLELSSEVDIIPIIGKKLGEIAANAFISIGVFHPGSMELKVRIFTDRKDLEEGVKKILGFTSSGTVVKITDEAAQNLIGGRLEQIPGGIFGLQPGVRESECKKLDEKFGPADLYAMGFCWEDRLFGNAVIYLPAGTPLKNKGIIETYIRLASVALQRRRAQEELSRERDLVALIMETSPVGIVLINKKGRITFANKLVKDKVKIDDARLYEMNFNSSEWNFEDLSGNPIKIQRLKQAQSLMRGEAAYAMNFSLRLPGGERIFVTVNGSPMTDMRGMLDGVILTMEDISERIKAERALRESEEKHRLLTENSSDVIWTSDLKERLTYVSPSVTAMTGYTCEEALALDPDDYFTPESHAFLRNELARELAGPVENLSPSRIFELRQNTKDGTIIDVEVSMTWLFGENGEPVGLQGSVRQITKRKQAVRALEKAHKNLALKAAELEEANAELAQYTYVVSHDMKAPLRAIHNYADFLSEDLEDEIGEEQKKYLTGLKLAVRQGEELVEDLLMLSRIGKQMRSIEQINMKLFLKNLVSYMDTSAEVKISGGDWPVLLADQTLLRQIFQNLIGNAVKFNRSIPKIVELGFLPAGPDHCEFFVKDNGIGIEKKYHEQIFMTFNRLHTKEEFEGNGIGLAIVRKAASKLGGVVRIESKPGAGSAFFIFLPKTQEVKNGP